MGRTAVKTEAEFAKENAKVVARNKEKTTVAVSFMRLQPILEIVEAAIWTGRLADEKPVSIMLIAEQESAKTECLKHFNGTKTLKFLSDLTSRGLTPYKTDIEKGTMRHLVIMDMVRIVNHGKGVSARTIQTLATIMEEGEADSSDAGGVSSWANFPQIGCLTAITPQFYESKRGHWRGTGFISRFLPVRFSYKEETVNEIHNAIAKGHKLPPPAPIKIFDGNVKIYLRDAEAKLISNRAKTLGSVNQVYGFRYHRALRCLAKASAAMNRRSEVNNDDVLKVLTWSDFLQDKVVEL